MEPHLKACETKLDTPEETHQARSISIVGMEGGVQAAPMALDFEEEMTTWPWRPAEAAPPPSSSDGQLAQLLQYYAGEPWSSSAYVAPQEFPEHDHVAEWAWGPPPMVEAQPPSPDQLMEECAGETWSRAPDEDEGLLLDQLMQDYFGEPWFPEELLLAPIDDYLR